MHARIAGSSDRRLKGQSDGRKPNGTSKRGKEIREAGGKIINAYALLGRYDYLYITEFPDQKKALKVLFKTAMKGRVAPESLVAIPLEEFL